MTTEIGFIQPESTGVSLDDASNALISQPRVPNPAPLCHRSEQWTLGDGGGLQPIFHRLHRAVDRASHDSNDLPLPFLIGLASADRNTHSFLGLLEVRYVQGDKFRTTKRPGEAEAVAYLVASRAELVTGSAAYLKTHAQRADMKSIDVELIVRGAARIERLAKIHYGSMVFRA